MGGCRVGEVSGAGQGHGVLANDVAILRDLDTGFTTVEMKLEHSKTGFSRYMNIAADTTGTAGVQCSRILEELWKEWGFTLTTYTQAGVPLIGGRGVA